MQGAVQSGVFGRFAVCTRNTLLQRLMQVTIGFSSHSPRSKSRFSFGPDVFLLACAWTLKSHEVGSDSSIVLVRLYGRLHLIALMSLLIKFIGLESALPPKHFMLGNDDQAASLMVSLEFFSDVIL